MFSFIQSIIGVETIQVCNSTFLLYFFTNLAYNHDICLLETSEDIISYVESRNATAEVACLPGFEINSSEACWVGGWGATENPYEQVLRPREAGVNLMDLDYCRNHAKI